MRRLRILVAWLWVAIPLAWGVYNSALNSLPLFRRPSQPASSSPAPAEAKPLR
jgi:hypothetical protein